MFIPKESKIVLAIAVSLFLTNSFGQEVKETNYNQGFKLGFVINGGLPTDNA